MDACANRIGLWLLIALSAAIFAGPQRQAAANDGEHCRPHHSRLFDGSTWRAWSRTWHSPNPLSAPLDPYYVPRTRPCSCDFTDCAIGCGGTITGYYLAHECEADALATGSNCGRCDGTVFVDAGFERLGQIPNDLAIAGALPAGAPSR